MENRLTIEPHHLTYDDLAKYFHQPINDVAQELGICATLLKKACRQNGIKRWPHRKIRSLDTLIDSFEEIIRTSPSNTQRIKDDLVQLREKREYLLSHPNVSYNDVIPKHVVNGYNIRINKLLTRRHRECSKPHGNVTRTIEKNNPSSRIGTPVSRPNYLDIETLCAPSSEESSPEFFSVSPINEAEPNNLRDSITSLPDEDHAANMLLCLQTENDGPVTMGYQRKTFYLPMPIQLRKQFNVMNNPPLVHQSRGIRTIADLINQVE